MFESSKHMCQEHQRVRFYCINLSYFWKAILLLLWWRLSWQYIWTKNSRSEFTRDAEIKWSLYFQDVCHRVEVTYISAHTGHELGTSELQFLPLPESTKPDIAQFTLLLDCFISHWEKTEPVLNTSLTTTEIDQVTKKLTSHAEHNSSTSNGTMLHTLS